jgi:localization factor PodJL
MTAGGPWSVKGIDPKAREIAKDLARRSGLTLGEWLNQVILEDEGPVEEAPRYPTFGRQAAPSHRRYEPLARPVDDVFRMSDTLDRLSARIEAADQRSANAINGIEQVVGELVARLDGDVRERGAAGARIDGALDGLRTEQASAAERLRKVEQNDLGARTDEALKAIEGALATVAAQLHERETQTSETFGGLRQELDGVYERLDGAFTEDAARELVESVLTRMTARLEQAEKRTSDALRGLEGAFAGLDQRLKGAEARLEDRSHETRLEALAERLTDQIGAVRADMAKAISASAADPRFQRLEQAVEAIDGHVRAAEQRSAGAIEKMGHEVLRMADTLARNVNDGEQRAARTLEVVSNEVTILRGDVARVSGDVVRMGADVAHAVRTSEGAAQSVSDFERRSADAVDRVSDEVSRVAETLARGLADAERRSAEAIERVGSQVTRVADTMEQRLNQADAVGAQALERLSAEIARITERMSERIANAERRQAQAIDDVGEQVARATERLQDRHEKATGDLADRIRQSEERTARFLDEARERIDKRLEETQKRAGEPEAPAYPVHTPLPYDAYADPAVAPFGDDSFAVPAPEFAALDAARQAPVYEETAFEAAAPDDDVLALDPIEHDEPLTYDGAAVDDPFSDDALLHAEIEAEAEPEAHVFGHAPAEHAHLHEDAVVFGDVVVHEALAEDEPEAHDAPHAEPADILHAAKTPFADDPFEDDPFADATLIEPALTEREDFGTGLFTESEVPSAEIGVDDDWLSPTALHADDGQEDQDDPFALDVAPAAEHAALAGHDDDADEHDPFGIEALAHPAATVEDHDEPAKADDGFAAADDFLVPEPARPRTTRELIEQARAAARASSAPADKGKGDAKGGSLFGGFGLGGGKKKQRGSTMRSALLVSGGTAALGVALAGYVILSEKPHGALPDRVAAALGAHGHIGKPAAGEISSNPLAAVALAPKPIAGQIADQNAPVLNGQGGAELYDDAVHRIEAKDRTGLVSLQKAANLGYAPAQFYLAKLYEDGQSGVTKDMAQARRWTERAAEGGDRKAMHNLALYNFEGVGGAKNLTTAAQWFRRAADLGLTDSQYNLARLYEEGFGVAQNPAEAYKWYLVASRSGDAESRMSALRIKGQLSAEAQSAAERAAQGFQAQSTQLASAPAPATTGGDAATMATAQKALTRLGFYQGPTDGSASPALKLAVAAYQRGQGLPATGQLDPNVTQKLAQVVAQ